MVVVVVVFVDVGGGGENYNYPMCTSDKAMPTSIQFIVNAFTDSPLLKVPGFESKVDTQNYLSQVVYTHN